MKIDVKDLVGENCITMDEGLLLNEAISQALSKRAKVDVDFEGVSVLATPFLNAAVGRLLKDWKAEELNELLNFKHVSPPSMDILRRVIENAKAYYSNPGSAKKIDEILARYSDE
jgi:hypothetical protein